VGVRKPTTGLRYADVLIIEESGLAGRPPRVETFSFKSRDLSQMEVQALAAQMIEDATEALHKYGGTLDIRRSSLQSLFSKSREVPVQRVYLVYEGGALIPEDTGVLREAANVAKNKVPGVGVLFQ
jgi:hypothetical protein